MLDTNDNAPEFTAEFSVFSIGENLTAPVEVGSVEATDADEGQFNLCFSLCGIILCLVCRC